MQTPAPPEVNSGGAPPPTPLRAARRGPNPGLPVLGKRFLGLLLALFVATAAPGARADRLLDLCDVVGARDNQLLGYGVVVGLDGTGDDVSAPFAMQSLRSLLRRLGVQIDQGQLRLRNVAAVLATTNIAPFARAGARLDVTVSSVGNARSLRGGVLVQTPMRGADRRTYAVAQGPLILGGFSAGGSAGGGVQANSTNTARVPEGALVEREIQTRIMEKGKIVLAVKQPSFLTVQRIVDAVNHELGEGSALALDGGAVQVTMPKELAEQAVSVLARLSGIEVSPEAVARVVINERTGTVVAGGDVRLLPVAIAQGGITINVKETKQVSQPGAFADGKTEVTTDSQVDAQEALPQMAYLDGAASLADVAQALSTFGVSPRELASILQALKSAGALRAEIVVQ
jgi:flagellar P-ring protein FlgI